MTIPELISTLSNIAHGAQRNAEFHVTLPCFAESGNRVELRFVLKDWNLYFVQTVPAKDNK